MPQSINGAAAAAGAWRAGGDEWGFGGCTARLRATAERGQRVGNSSKARNKNQKEEMGRGVEKPKLLSAKLGQVLVWKALLGGSNLGVRWSP